MQFIHPQKTGERNFFNPVSRNLWEVIISGPVQGGEIKRNPEMEETAIQPVPVQATDSIFGLHFISPLCIGPKLLLPMGCMKLGEKNCVHLASIGEQTANYLLNFTQPMGSNISGPSINLGEK